MDVVELRMELSMPIRHLPKLLAAQTFLALVVAETLDQRARRDAMVSLFGNYLFIVDC